MFAPVVRDETWDPPEVGEDMDGDQREPDQNTEAVQGEEWASRTRAGHHESDPTADDHEGRGDEQRGQHPQRQAGRASAHEGGRPGVIAEEAVEGRADLDGERAGEDHPDEDMCGQPRTQIRRGHELNHDQHEEHRAGQRGQPLVADHRGLIVTVPSGRLGLARWAHGPMIAERFHRLSFLHTGLVACSRSQLRSATR
ncbi:MAG: hypothetical protein E6J36_06385 [Chloroflexi bacterium]|nr:MAG: hypothetical protein E6J36_06385 [Chloroflexota bacterium]